MQDEGHGTRIIQQFISARELNSTVAKLEKEVRVRGGAGLGLGLGLGSEGDDSNALEGAIYYVYTRTINKDKRQSS